jgi:hypothetical protein
LNIAIGKIGKSIKFNRKSWGVIGGDNEAPEFFEMLAKKNPQNTYYVVGRTDLHRIKNNDQDIPNLISIWGDFDSKTMDAKTYPLEYFEKNNIKIDKGIFLSGPTQGSLGILYKTNDLKKGKKVIGKALMMATNYVAPIAYYLNETKIPWIMINNDPRYLKLAKDWFNPPKKILSQYNTKIAHKMANLEDQLKTIYVQLDVQYAEMEKICLLDLANKKMNPKITSERTKTFGIILNEGGNGVPSRYPELKKYVLDYIDDVEVYGQWKHKEAEKDSRFKGSMPFHDMPEYLNEIKYTFIIPIQKGWVTAKIWEMISNGVIPFLHPNYDDQNHIDVPDFLRIKNPEDLHNKIEKLEANPDIASKLQKGLLEKITQSDINGDNLNNIIDEALNKL